MPLMNYQTNLRHENLTRPSSIIPPQHFVLGTSSVSSTPSFLPLLLPQPLPTNRSWDPTTTQTKKINFLVLYNSHTLLHSTKPQQILHPKRYPLPHALLHIALPTAPPPHKPLLSTPPPLSFSATIQPPPQKPTSTVAQ